MAKRILCNLYILLKDSVCARQVKKNIEIIFLISSQLKRGYISFQQFQFYTNQRLETKLQTALYSSYCKSLQLHSFFRRWDIIHIKGVVISSVYHDYSIFNPTIWSLTCQIICNEFQWQPLGLNEEHEYEHEWKKNLEKTLTYKSSVVVSISRIYLRLEVCGWKQCKNEMNKMNSIMS